MSILEILFEGSKILGSLVVGLLTSRYFFNKGIDIEAQRVHSNRLREQVVEPMLKALKEGTLGYTEDEKLGYRPYVYAAGYALRTTEPKEPKGSELSQLLYKDLVENHYPTLKNQFKSYVERTEDLRKKKERRDGKAIEFVEGDLKRDGLQYERDAGKISKEKIVYSGGLATWLLYFMKHRKWIKDLGINVIREGRLYKVRAGDFGLYSTDDEGEAEKVKVQLERIILEYTDNEELKLLLEECDEAEREKQKERERLITYLGMLREKTKLKIGKERLRAKCPYITA